MENLVLQCSDGGKPRFWLRLGCERCGRKVILQQHLYVTARALDKRIAFCHSMTPVSFANMPGLTSRRYFEPIARESTTFRFLDPPDTFRLSATVLPTVSFYHLPMGLMKDDTSLMLNNVSRYPLPVLPSNPCVGFRLVLRIIIRSGCFTFSHQHCLESL